MKGLVLTIWFLVINLDVIRNLTIICVRYQTPIYWKTTVLRSIIALIICFLFASSFIQFIQIGCMCWLTYAFPFDTLMNVSRDKPLLHMGTNSLPEKLFSGNNLFYFCVKLWLYLLGIAVLYYQELLATIPL